MKKELYIIGAGGFGREVAWLVERINRHSGEWIIKGFIDDNPSMWGMTINGYDVVGGISFLQSKGEDTYIVCAIGSAAVRKIVIEKLMANGCKCKFATLIDPSVIMSDSVTVGVGSIICAGTIATVNISIGNHSIINLDCTIGHDACLSDFVTLYPSVNISGCVSIENSTECGTGAHFIQGISVCAESIIGAGTVVIRNIEEKGTYVGVPAKKVGA